MIHWIICSAIADQFQSGETIINPAANDNLDGFTGHIKDVTTGLNYMQARYYDPALGRFLSIDPVGFMPRAPYMFNRYTYVGNDPINETDPTGQCPWCVAFLINTAVNAAIQYAETGEVNIGAAIVSGAVDTVNPAAAAVKIAKVSKLVGAAVVANRKMNKTKVECCFVAGTLVETKDGLRPIEKLQVGDLVLARDTDTGETAFKAITDLIRRHERVIWEVSLSGADGETELFETTDNHPWWIAGIGWKTTEELTPNMSVITADGRGMIIRSATQTSRLDATYNITVADFETYFVGKQKVLVHNCKNKGTGRGRNNLTPDSNASGDHSTFRTDADGNITNTATYKGNPQNPTGFDEVKRVDLTGKGHRNKKTKENVPTPHVHGKDIPGGVRPARKDEIPNRPEKRAAN